MRDPLDRTRAALFGYPCPGSLAHLKMQAATEFPRDNVVLKEVDEPPATVLVAASDPEAVIRFLAPHRPAGVRLVDADIYPAVLALYRERQRRAERMQRRWTGWLWRLWYRLQRAP